jgi:electron transfer flavoprotein alpha subunit
MAALLVLCEHDRGELPVASLEALTAGRGLADALGTNLEAVVIGNGADALAPELARHGASVVHHVDHDLLTDYGPDAWAQSMVQLIADTSPAAVMSVGTDRGNEIIAQLGARLDLPFVANCLTIEPGDVWSITRMQWGGSLLEDVELAAPLPLVTFAHHAVEAEPADATAAAAEVRTMTPQLDESATATMIRDRVVLSEGVTLSTASVVVSGGRGVGSADNFASLEELAELLGGRVGCSRAVTNNGWRNHSDQVGQTGTRIAPEIYIACGISGAIQHWVGAMASKNILAINTDAEANMVTKAGYAVIADLHDVVPAISSEIRRRRG